MNGEDVIGHEGRVPLGKGDEERVGERAGAVKGGGVMRRCLLEVMV